MRQYMTANLFTDRRQQAPTTALLWDAFLAVVLNSREQQFL